MAVIDFPSKLGSFLAENYSFTPRAGIRRTQMNSGNARQRRKANQRTTTNASLILDLDQMQVFEVFILRSAWDWFNAVVETGEGRRQVECRIIESTLNPQRIDYERYKVSLVLEMKNTNAIADDPELTGEYIEAFYAYGLNDVQASALLNPLSPLNGD